MKWSHYKSLLSENEEATDVPTKRTRMNEVNLTRPKITSSKWDSQSGFQSKMSIQKPIPEVITIVDDSDDAEIFARPDKLDRNPRKISKPRVKNDESYVQKSLDQDDNSDLVLLKSVSQSSKTGTRRKIKNKYTPEFRAQPSASNGFSKAPTPSVYDSLFDPSTSFANGSSTSRKSISSASSSSSSHRFKLSSSLIDSTKVLDRQTYQQMLYSYHHSGSIGYDIPYPTPTFNRNRTLGTPVTISKLLPSRIIKRKGSSGSGPAVVDLTKEESDESEIIEIKSSKENRPLNVNVCSSQNLATKPNASVQESTSKESLDEALHRPSSLGSSKLYESSYLKDNNYFAKMREHFFSSDRVAQMQIEAQEADVQILSEKRSQSLQEKIKALMEFRKLQSELNAIEEEEILPEITDEMSKRIDEALRPAPTNEVLVEAYNLPIRRRDMETLKGLNWLNDEIINFYFTLLMERGKLNNFPSVYSCNTFFYPKLMSGGHAAVKRWTRKVDIFSHDFILIPVHLGMHWCLSVVNFKAKRIEYYDSMGGNNNPCLQALKKYLEAESLDKKKATLNTSDWTLENIKGIPQQMNGSDCGMFSCKYAEYVSRNAKITFKQENMPYFRRRMVYEILTNRLM